MKSLKFAAIGLLLLITATAGARSLPGIAGHAYFPSEQTCFFPQATWAGVQNACTGTRSFVIPIENTLTSTGSITVRANPGGSCPASGPCLASPPQCTAFQVAAAGGLIAQSSTVTLLVATSTVIGTFSTVAPTDTLHVICSMPGTDNPLALGLMSVSW